MLETNALLKKDVQTKMIYVPASTIASLKREFSLTDESIAESVERILQKAIEERIADNNSSVFTEAETKELEEDLKGLGYI